MTASIKTKKWQVTDTDTGEILWCGDRSMARMLVKINSYTYVPHRNVVCHIVYE